ncbi:hypothetical protein [Pseudomonas baetica]|uniref:hypothetical protein n=1 Tax=Pseudomonas baetica TaxID=674054 RepID=UPI001EDE0ADE|nr:hypothetical protein [Pseudomonas baetica]
MELARHPGKEQLAGGGLNNRQFNDVPGVTPDSPLAKFYQQPDTVFTPRVLKDGADSVGALGALNRVFINIGLYSVEWTTHFRPLIGGKPITPSSGAGHAAGNQRLQPPGDQRPRRQYLGQLLLAVVQAIAGGRADAGAEPLHRRSLGIPDAGRRARLHAAGVADQPVVHRAAAAQQPPG